MRPEAPDVVAIDQARARFLHEVFEKIRTSALARILIASNRNLGQPFLRSLVQTNRSLTSTLVRIREAQVSTI
jgi:hypothetical protein